jgi:hypothetical protein
MYYKIDQNASMALAYWQSSNLLWAVSQTLASRVVIFSW